MTTTWKDAIYLLDPSFGCCGNNMPYLATLLSAYAADTCKRVLQSDPFSSKDVFALSIRNKPNDITVAAHYSFTEKSEG